MIILFASLLIGILLVTTTVIYTKQYSMAADFLAIMGALIIPLVLVIGFSIERIMNYKERRKKTI